MRPALFLLMPDWLVVWVAVTAVGAAILGLRRLAMGLAVLPLADWVLLPMVGPVLDSLPIWVSVVVLVVIALLILHALIASVFGREAAGFVVGTYLVRLIDWLFRSPLRLGRMVRRLFP
jgi:hypothetical protein